MEWLSDHKIKVDPPKRPKKITGTRFAAILGLNVWSTPFEAWCAITRTYEKPFEDTIYTIAGKTIEPKQAEYMRKAYVMDLLTPTDKYGPDYFKKTYGDFFPEDHIFGGMWDYLMMEDGEPCAVLEMKTTKRAEDWLDGPPEYYAMQAALYAYLLGLNDVIMVCSFLTDKDYEHPENYVCTAKNTITYQFTVSERYPDMDEIIADCRKWWEEHVVTGISPAFDEKKDAEILTALSSVEPKGEIVDILAQAELLKAKLAAHDALVADDRKKLKTLEDGIKKALTKGMGNADKLIIKGNTYIYTLSKKTSMKLDEDLLKKDVDLAKYMKPSDSYTLTSKIIKE